MQFYAMLATCGGAAKITFSFVVVPPPVSANGAGERGTVGHAQNPH